MIVIILSAFLGSIGTNSANAQDVGPYGETMFLRGEMNGWGLANPMEYKGINQDGEHYYEVNVDLAIGYLAFKIANEFWNLNYAASGTERVEIPLNQRTPLEPAGGAVMRISYLSKNLVVTNSPCLSTLAIWTTPRY